MPDIGGFGRGLLKGALSATEKAAEKVKEAAEAASRKITDDDDPEATQVVRSGSATAQAAPDEPDPDATQVIKVEDPDATQVVRTAPTAPPIPAPPAGVPARATPPAAPPRGNAPAGTMPPVAAHSVGASSAAPLRGNASAGAMPPAAAPSVGAPLRGNAPSAAMPPAAAHSVVAPAAASPADPLLVLASPGAAPSEAQRPAAASLGAVPPAVAPLGAASPVVASSGAGPSAARPATPPSAAAPLATPLSVAAPPAVAPPPGAAPSAGARPAAASLGAAPPVAVPPAVAPSAVGAAPAQASAGAGDEDDERADASEVRELVEMFQQLLAKRRPPAGPVPGEWSVGIGDLLGEHPKVPKRVRGLVLKLNRFGGLGFSPQEVSFDGDDVPWEKVTEVRTRHIVDYLVGDAVQQQVENLPMPWFPGRQRLLDALGQALLTVTIATAKDQLDGLDVNFRIPAEVVYKGAFGRSKELGAGVVSALVLADPAVSQSLVATAQARGVTVTASEDEMLADADERAEQIRQKVKALEAELDRFSKRFKRTTDG